MIESDLGIKISRKRRRYKDEYKSNGLEDPVFEDKNRLLKLKRSRERIINLENELKDRPTKKEFETVNKKNKKLQVKISDLRYKVLLLESKNKTLRKKLADGNK